MEPTSTANTEKRAEFLKNAARAEARAEATTDPQLKASWRECAAAWRYLAERVGGERS